MTRATACVFAIVVLVTAGCGTGQPSAGANAAPDAQGRASTESAAPDRRDDTTNATQEDASYAVRPAPATSPQSPSSQPPPGSTTARTTASAGPVSGPQTAPRTNPAAVASKLRSQVASWKGVPYRDNGTTKSGIGNAGFTRALVKAVFDVDLPDKADRQMQTGKLVDPKAVEPGDLVFFDGNGFGPFRSRTVGIALGGGEAAVATKDLGVTVIRLSEERWQRSLKAARRVSAPPSKDAPQIDASAFGNNREALLTEVAKAWVGTLYKTGGTTFEGIGNDEFVRSVYEAIYDAELEGEPKQWATRGQAVSRANLEPGDIILYDAGGIGKLVDQQHAGMYIGNGSFVHAVKGSAVTISKLDDPKWRKAFSRARRIPPPDDDAPTVAKADQTATRTSGAGTTAAITPARSLTDTERRLRDSTAAWLGTPYKLGGNTKSGVDCSGFVKAVYRDVYGVDLPRTAEEQETLGQKVDRQDLRTGDLVFFRTKGMGPFFKSRHVGVYLGGGEFAQASGSKGVNISPLSNRYWSKKYEGARRLKAASAN
ncbi:MAG: NlpC/P60 family protein [Vicinamibacterales bacterium]